MNNHWRYRSFLFIAVHSECSLSLMEVVEAVVVLQFWNCRSGEKVRIPNTLHYS